MKAKEYFKKAYGENHMKSVIDLKDEESLYDLIEEFTAIIIIKEKEETREWLESEGYELLAEKL